MSICGVNVKDDIGEFTGNIEEITNKDDTVVSVPQNQIAGEHGPTSIEIKYDSVASAQYRVHLFDTTTNSFIHQIQDQTHHRFTNLVVNRAYKAAVTAVVNENESPMPNNWIAVSTLAKEAEPFVPTGIATSTVTETTAEVIVKSPVDLGGSALLQYTIYYREKGDTEWMSVDKRYPKAEDTLIVKDLDDGTEYEFQATATNKHGESPRTSTIST